MLDIKELYLKDYIDQEITVNGWIKNHRKQAHFGFIDLSDGTYFKGLQVVYDDNLKDFEEVSGYFPASHATLVYAPLKVVINGLENLRINNDLICS